MDSSQYKRAITMWKRKRWKYLKKE
jgi:hypothetical protein